MANNEITFKDHIERRLSAMVASDPTVYTRLATDADAVIKPIISEVLGDDGGAGLRDITTSVHFETSDHIHFVVTLSGADEPEPEVVGLAASFDIASTLRTGSISIDDVGGGTALFGKKTSTGKKCCTVSDPCHTVTCQTSDCTSIVDLCRSKV